MFYVLNFQTHEFEPCGTMAQTAQKIRDFQSAGAYKEHLLVVNAAGKNIQLSVSEYWALEKAARKVVEEDPERCPVCGCDLTQAGDEEDGYGHLHCYWSCQNCGTTGKATYDESDGNVFLGHEVD